MVAWLHLTCQPLLRGYNTLLDFNSELEGSEYAMSSKAIVTTLLDAVTVYDFTYVRNFKTNNKSLIDDHNKVWDELSVVLEDSDRREAKVRAQEQRNALRAEKVASADVAQLLSTLVDAKFADMSASSAKKSFPKCKKCGTQHPGVCIAGNRLRWVS